MQRVADIRQKLIQKYIDQDFVIDRTGVKTVELIGESFLADEDWIIRKPNYEYIQRELEWYCSCSLRVDDIPGDTPSIWNSISSKNNLINSNYGYLVWSDENGNQYEKAYQELKKNPDSRRATMIYNRPSMHVDYNRDGMNDFVCTYANQFFIRGGKLVSHYIMRSNDVVYGYNNDLAWARYIQSKLANDLNIEVGDLIWTASSLHVYSYHFIHLERMLKKNDK